MLDFQQRHALDSDLAAAAEGDDAAIAALYRATISDVTSFVRRRSSGDCEAIAHAALERTIRKLPEIESLTVPVFRAYLFRAARNLIIDDARSSQRDDRFNFAGPQALALVPDPARSTEARVADAGLVSDLMGGLTDAQRQVIEYRFFEDLSLEETADRTGMSLTGVKGMQRRALLAMRATLVAAAIIALLVFGFRSITGDVEEVPVIAPPPVVDPVEGSDDAEPAAAESEVEDAEADSEAEADGLDAREADDGADERILVGPKASRSAGPESDASADAASPESSDALPTTPGRSGSVTEPALEDAAPATNVSQSSGETQASTAAVPEQSQPSPETVPPATAPAPTEPAQPASNSDASFEFEPETPNDLAGDLPLGSLCAGVPSAPGTTSSCVSAVETAVSETLDDVIAHAEAVASAAADAVSVPDVPSLPAGLRPIPTLPALPTPPAVPTPPAIPTPPAVPVVPAAASSSTVEGTTSTNTVEATSSSSSHAQATSSNSGTAEATSTSGGAAEATNSSTAHVTTSITLDGS